MICTRSKTTYAIQSYKLAAECEFWAVRVLRASLHEEIVDRFQGVENNDLVTQTMQTDDIAYRRETAQCSEQPVHGPHKPYSRLQSMNLTQGSAVG